MLPNKIKYTIAIGILLLSVLFFYSSCKKECIQCKTQFKNFELVKNTDTILIETCGRDEDIYILLKPLIDTEYSINRITKDSLFFENYCTKDEINIYEKSDNKKKYCYYF